MAATKKSVPQSQQETLPEKPGLKMNWPSDIRPTNYHIVQEHKNQTKDFCNSQTSDKLSEEIFKKYDKDQDGFLNLIECESFVKDAHKNLNLIFEMVSEEAGLQMEDFFSFIDRNTDNKIDLDDFKNIFRQFLTPASHQLMLGKQYVNVCYKSYKDDETDSRDKLNLEEVFLLLIYIYKQLGIPKFTPTQEQLLQDIKKMKQNAQQQPNSLKKQQQLEKEKDCKEIDFENLTQDEFNNLFVYTLVSGAGFVFEQNQKLY